MKVITRPRLQKFLSSYITTFGLEEEVKSFTSLYKPPSEQKKEDIIDYFHSMPAFRVHEDAGTNYASLKRETQRLLFHLLEEFKIRLIADYNNLPFDLDFLTHMLESEGRLFFLPTTPATFSSNPSHWHKYELMHPMLTVSPIFRYKNGVGETIPMLYNDILRIIHDVLGHYYAQSDSSAEGEEEAYSINAKYLTYNAVRAFATEQRFQSIWTHSLGIDEPIYPIQKVFAAPYKLCV